MTEHRSTDLRSLSVPPAWQPYVDPRPSEYLCSLLQVPFLCCVEGDMAIDEVHAGL